MRGFLRIGDLARLGGVSVKALRFYDDQGLLSPDHVDPQTGYRYYSLDQSKTLAVITNLRLIDFTIAEIAALLRDDTPSTDDIKKSIAIKQRDIKAAQSHLANKLQMADMMARSLEDATASALPTFKLAPLPAQNVFSIKQTVPHLGQPVTTLFERAETIVANDQARAPSAPFLIFHDPPTVKENLEVEVCIPLTTTHDDQMLTTHLSGSDIACSVVYAGGYFKTETLYQQMSQWIRQAGLTASGPMRELYHRFGADQDDYRLPAKMIARSQQEFLTELQIPVALSQTHMEIS